MHMEQYTLHKLHILRSSGTNWDVLEEFARSLAGGNTWGGRVISKASLSLYETLVSIFMLLMLCKTGKVPLQNNAGIKESL